MINSHNSGPCPPWPNPHTIEVVPSSIISEQRNRTSVPYHNLTQSIRNNTALEPLILYVYIALSTGVGSQLTSDIEPPDLKRLLHAYDWMVLNTYTQPVTRSKSPTCKVPFAVTRHICDPTWANEALWGRYQNWHFKFTYCSISQKHFDTKTIFISYSYQKL